MFYFKNALDKAVHIHFTKSHFLSTDILTILIFLYSLNILIFLNTKYFFCIPKHEGYLEKNHLRLNCKLNYHTSSFSNITILIRKNDWQLVIYDSAADIFLKNEWSVPVASRKITNSIFFLPMIKLELPNEN